jgi:hypothetical protein
MLDAPDLDYRDVLAAIKRWQPDPQCLAAGDEHALLALRCYAAAGLCDTQITGRVLDLVGVSTQSDTPDIGHDDAAIAVARHCAIVGMSFSEIIEVLVYLAAEVPGWLDDPDAIASLVRSAITEAMP